MVFEFDKQTSKYLKNKLPFEEDFLTMHKSFEILLINISTVQLSDPARFLAPKGLWLQL
jgi:hypothetical protein